MRERELKEQLDKVMDKILTYKPEKKKKTKIGKKKADAKRQQ